MRSRRYVFTLNNYTPEEEKALQETDCRYIGFGREKGDSGTPHLQGLICFPQPKSLEQLKRINERCHWEIMRGTPQQAREYAAKENDFFERGDLPQQGQRNDINAIIDAIKQGKRLREIAEEQPSIARYTRFYQLMREEINCNDAPKWRDVGVRVFWGATGTGKTRAAVALHDSYYKLDPANQLWFNGYDGEKHLIIDDFYGGIRYHHLLNLLDGYKMRIEIKGGFTYARWTEVTFTSNKHPNEWYNSNDTTALFRRIGDIRKFE